MRKKCIWCGKTIFRLSGSLAICNKCRKKHRRKK
jgi:hypothetical protein